MGARSTAQRTSDAPARAAARAPRAVEAGNRSARVDAVMARWSRPDGPGAAVAVINDGVVVHHKGYGIADLDSGARIGPDTVFDLASITKQFTAMAIMMLVERGELSYGDSLHSLIGIFPSYARRVSIRHLLTHTAGLDDYERLFLTSGAISRHQKPGGFEPSMHDTIALLARQPAPRFTPGTVWEYSNSGYVVLAHIVEIVSGERFDAFLKQHIFRPLGMTQTVVGPIRRRARTKAATSYRSMSPRAKALDYTPFRRIVGDGNVYSTTADLIQWDAALANETLVANSTLTAAQTPADLKTGVTTGYGFGWSLGRYLGLSYAGHGGEWLGFRTLYCRFPEQRLSVILLANTAAFKMLEPLKDIVTVYLPAEVRLPRVTKLSAGSLRHIVGRYRFDSGQAATVALARGALWLQWEHGPRMRLLPESDRVFVADGVEMMRVAFTPAGRRRVGRLEVDFVGNEVAYKDRPARR